MYHIFTATLLLSLFSPIAFAQLPYTIVDTDQIRCYDNRTEIVFPKSGQPFFGQDAQYTGNTPKYKDNRNGTISDLRTGLMWTKDPGKKVTWGTAMQNAKKCKVGGYSDWRLPTVKELYSLILFSGNDFDPQSQQNLNAMQPFIDRSYFNFSYGDTSKNERSIDSQFATSTIYKSTTMQGNKTMFGVNFADGRIKGYPVGATRPGRGEKTYYALFVRGNTQYGKNRFKANNDGTVTDFATGLTWMQVDSGHLRAGKRRDGKLNWQEALAWSENLTYAGKSDWRLPNAKELQSLVDYERSPDTTRSAAIDPLFKVTPIKNGAGVKDYPYYWSSTSHCRDIGAQAAVYVAFGRATGWMTNRQTGKKQLFDVHGAGAQRSDTKSGDASKIPYGRGPQGDVVRIDNFVRCVRGGAAEPCSVGPKLEPVPQQQRRSSGTNSQPPQHPRHPMPPRCFGMGRRPPRRSWSNSRRGPRARRLQ